ncbi:Altered inheritance of mitochondria protein 6 [Xanthoria parietina]
MRRAVDPPAADEEQPTCTSSQPLLKQDTPERPRWRTTRRDFYHDEKLMRGLKPRCCARLGLGTLIFLGLIQLFSVLGGLLIVFVPDGIHRILNQWGRLGHIGQGLSSWPTDFSRGILPKPCHSHNDYWRRVPLYSAIEAGCMSVEADVWLFREELYIGHSLASLTPNRTLASLYVDPLVQILEKQNPTTQFHPDGNVSQHGVFDTAPEQSLTLLIDFKTSGSALFPYVLSALEPLRSRGHLTYRNGTQTINRPITVVGTGNTPFSLVDSDLTNPHHDIFFDAPLAAMWEGLPGETSTPAPKPESSVYGADIDASLPDGSASERQQQPASGEDLGQGMSGAAQSPDAYTSENSFYASVSFAQAIGHVVYGKLSESQMNLIRGHIRGAHRRGLKARYWELPFWPIGLRNHVWDVLVKEGVDLLNVDDLKGATETDWGSKTGWWS